MKSYAGILSALLVVLVLIVVVACDRNDHFDRHHKKLHGHHRHHPEGRIKLHLAEEGNARNETVEIAVTRDQNNADGSKSTLKVNLRIHIIEGRVHINHNKIDHAVVTAIHLKTNLVERSSSGAVMSHRALVQVRVMVVEAVNKAGVKTLAIQEEITAIDGEKVTQIEIKEVVLELADKLHESKRTITTIRASESKIRNIKRKGDKVVWACRGRLPKKPYFANKDDMKAWERKHPSERRPPTFELGRNHGDDDDDDDKDDDDKDDDDNDRKHGERHHHRKPRWARHFCKWFYSLPVGTRAVFCISWILGGLLIVVGCCSCLCKKTRKPVAEEKKYELDGSGFEAVDMEASPLPQKKALDKQQLIA